MTSIMLHMLQMKGLYEGQAFEDRNVHLKNFVEVCASLNIAHITQESIRLRLFPFSITSEAVLWLRSLLPDSITSWDELTMVFLDKYFPP